VTQLEARDQVWNLSEKDQGARTQFLVAESCQSTKIYGRMSGDRGNACVSNTAVGWYQKFCYSGWLLST
jgi:hypothetical protein